MKMSSTPYRIVKWERELAALIRNFGRADQAQDDTACEVTKEHLSNVIERMAESALHEAKLLGHKVDLHLDGIGLKITEVGPHCQLRVSGGVHCLRASDTTACPGRLIAELQAAETGPQIVRFDLCFGDWEEFQTRGLVEPGVPGSVLIPGEEFVIEFGAPATELAGAPQLWAIRITKLSKDD
jgi:hypothetical protein